MVNHICEPISSNQFASCSSARVGQGGGGAPLTLYLRLRELILASGKIAVDETVAPVLDPGRGRTKKGYFWAIARDDRPWGGTDPPAVAYSYAPGRGAVHALKLLEHYRGIVQCDGYAAYKSIADAACGEAITRFLPSRWECRHPHPSQTRTCGIPASGSSRKRFARDGVFVNDLGPRQGMTVEKR